MDLGYYWKIFRRRLPYVIILAALGTAIGVSLAMTLPPTYNSEATLIVESEQIPGDLAETTVRTGEVEALQIIRQRILSRDVLLELANELEIYPPESELTADQKVDDLRERIQFTTTGGQTSSRGPRDATIVTVGFTAETGRLAAETANEVVTLILQENVEMRTAVARQTLDFFTQEVDRLEQSLSRVSSQIREFRENNLEALPDSLEFRRGQQATLQERLAELEREQASLREQRDRLTTLYEATGQTALDGSGRQPRLQASPAQERLDNLRSQYAELSGVLAEGNPRLAALRSQIESAEAAVKSASAATAEGDTAASSEQQLESSLYQMQLSDLDSQIAYIDEQREAARERMEQLTRSIEQTPGNAVTLDSLERDYENLQAQYNQAVANRARAETGSMIESLSRGQRISVVEQAVPPTSPSSPNRPVISVAGLMGGLGLGVALIVLMELLNSAVRRPQDIRNALGIETFATIPYMVTQRERMRRRTVTLTTALILLVGVPGGLWYIDRNVMPVQPLFESVLDKVNLGHLI